MMKKRIAENPVLIVLLGLLLTSLLAYMAGVIPYPFGWLIIIGFILARFLGTNGSR